MSDKIKVSGKLAFIIRFLWVQRFESVNVRISHAVGLESIYSEYAYEGFELA